eukprot:425654-Pelagomonas_calceolata.AAC.2
MSTIKQRTSSNESFKLKKGTKAVQRIGDAYSPVRENGNKTNYRYYEVSCTRSKRTLWELNLDKSTRFVKCQGKGKGPKGLGKNNLPYSYAHGCMTGLLGLIRSHEASGAACWVQANGLLLLLLALGGGLIAAAAAAAAGERAYVTQEKMASPLKYDTQYLHYWSSEPCDIPLSAHHNSGELPAQGGSQT